MRRCLRPAILVLAVGVFAPSGASARTTLDLDLPNQVSKGDTRTIDGAIGGTGSHVRVTFSDLRRHRWHTRKTAVARVPDRFRLRFDVPDRARYGVRVRLTRGGHLVAQSSRIWDVRRSPPPAVRTLAAAAWPLVEALISIVTLAGVVGIVVCVALLFFGVIADAITFMLETVLPIAVFVGVMFAAVALFHH